MTENPDFLNLKFTSFKKKEEYTPPSGHNLFFQKPKKNKNKTKFVPGGEWADDTSDSELNLPSPKKKKPNFPNFLNPKEKNSPDPKKSSKFSFIKKNKKKSKSPQKDKLLSFTQITSKSYNFERKLVNEIISPVGATKKPQESLLSKFAQKSSSFEPYIIYSIIFHVLKNEDANWISKLRCLYCIDYLLKQKKYFEFLKKKMEILDCVDLESFKEVSKNSFSNMRKMMQRIRKKLDKNFEDCKAKGFDMSKLEGIKKSTNQNFFENMEKLKKKDKKKDLGFLGNEDEKEKDLDLLNFEFEGKNGKIEVNQKNGIKDKEDLIDVFGNFDVGGKVEEKKKDDLDIFGLSENVEEKKISNDFILEDKKKENTEVSDPFDFLSL